MGVIADKVTRLPNQIFAETAGMACTNWGIPCLTGPFVFTAWIFMLAAPLALNIPDGIGWGRP